MSFQVVADESVDFRIVTALRNSGLQIYSIAEKQSSIRDEDVLNVAVSNDALLITEDKDFGELVFRLRLAHKGILLIRIEDKEQQIESIVQAIFKNINELKNRFSVLSKNKLRIKE
jgi:predicted nuclease of predicted toxin-antitoxin system